MDRNAVRWTLAVTAAGLALAGCGRATTSTNTSGASIGPVHWQSLSGPSFAGARVLGVTTKGDGCVAVGVTGPPAATVPASWTSPDCRTWTASPGPASDAGDGPPPSLPGGASRHAVTMTGVGTLVAVGDQTVMADDESSEASVWTSSDGRQWTAVNDPQDLGTIPGYVQGAPQGPVHQRAMTAVTTDSSRTVVLAVGNDDGAAATWTSSNLTTWVRTDLPAAATGPGSDTATGVIDSGQGLVIVGNRTETTANGSAVRTVPVAWSESDTNQLTPVLLPATRSATTVAAVAGDGNSIIAAGTSADLTGSAPPQPVIWTSTDRGHTWTETTLPGSGDVETAASSLGGVVIGGTTSTDPRTTDPRALVWLPAVTGNYGSPLSPGAGGILAVADPLKGVLVAGDDGMYARNPAPMWLDPASG